jgi:hypothetical protein
MRVMGSSAEYQRKYRKTLQGQRMIEKHMYRRRLNRTKQQLKNEITNIDVELIRLRNKKSQLIKLHNKIENELKKTY